MAGNVHDAQQDLPIFASLPPLSTLTFGLALLIFSLLLIFHVVRTQQRKYQVPVESLHVALAANFVSWYTATIKATSCHDPFMNMNFPTTHLRRKVYMYNFIKVSKKRKGWAN